jgi:hypothetical protein
LRDGNDLIHPYTAWRSPRVDRFNDIWSLDDVEYALWKYDIWHTYVNLNTTNGATTASGITATDVVLTWPTKHYHHFFQDWPWWNDMPRNATAVKGNMDPLAFPYPWVLPFLNEQSYWNAVDDYRGRIAVNNTALAYGAEGSAWSYSQTNGWVPSQGGNTVAQQYLLRYQNGPIQALPWMWDNDENYKISEIPTPVPPGSPWRPTPEQPAVFIPHEVNILRVGNNDPVLDQHPVEDASGFLSTQYQLGQWRFFYIALTNGMRDFGPYLYSGIAHPLYGVQRTDSIFANYYHLPPIGVSIFYHGFTDDTAGITRTSMAEWKYKWGLNFWSEQQLSVVDEYYDGPFGTGIE